MRKVIIGNNTAYEICTYNDNGQRLLNHIKIYINCFKNNIFNVYYEPQYAMHAVTIKFDESKYFNDLNNLKLFITIVKNIFSQKII